MKPRPPRRRKPHVREFLPPDVPEAASPVASEGTGAVLPAPNAESDLLPEHIRRMLEAAYT